MDLDITCPRCKTSRFRNPSLKLLVNICGHSLCEACVDLLFAGRASGHCPECHVPLKRSLYHLQVFQDSSVEREVEIRKRLSKEVFNKTRSDFPTHKEYNDYLEFIEDIVFELLNSNKNKTGDSMVEAAKKKIELYKKENKDSIIKNKGKLSEEQLEIKELLEEESLTYQKNSNQRDEQGLRKENGDNFGLKNSTMVANTSARDLISSNEALLYQLATSDLPADIIVKTHKANEGKMVSKVSMEISLEGMNNGNNELSKRITQEKPVPSSSSTLFKFDGNNLEHTINFSSRINVDEDRLSPYDYIPFQQYNFGPQPPETEMLEPLGYLYNVRAANSLERAGGYTEKLACSRAVQEAFSGLYFSPPLS